MYDWWSAFRDLAAIGSEATREAFKEQAFSPNQQQEQERFMRAKEKARKRLDRHLKAFFGDTGVTKLQAGGVTLSDSEGGPHPVFENGRRIILHNIETGNSIEVTGNEALSLGNFLIWFWTCGPAGGYLDPNQWVIEQLAQQGIDQSNYYTHPKSPKDLITNPWS